SGPYNVANNTVYGNSDAGIRAEGVNNQGVVLLNNTVYEPTATAVDVTGASVNVVLRNNILWSGESGGYTLRVADDSQSGFASNYNDLYFTGGAHLGFWQTDFDSLLDWTLEL